MDCNRTPGSTPASFGLHRWPTNPKEALPLHQVPDPGARARVLLQCVHQQSVFNYPACSTSLTVKVKIWFPEQKNEGKKINETVYSTTRPIRFSKGSSQLDLGGGLHTQEIICRFCPDKVKAHE